MICSNGLGDSALGLGAVAGRLKRRRFAVQARRVALKRRKARDLDQVLVKQFARTPTSSWSMNAVSRSFAWICSSCPRICFPKLADALVELAPSCRRGRLPRQA